MNFTPEILAAAIHEGICDAYYKLCEEHPFVPGANNEKARYKDVLMAAEGTVQLTRLGGPGTVFGAGGLPDGLSLNFIIQSGNSVETHFIIRGAGNEQQGTFATLCNDALRYAGLPPPNPAYPRPVCSSTTELVGAFRALQELAITLFGALRGGG
jgi:hypothetical protein